MGGLTSFASTAMQALSVANAVAGATDSYEKNNGKLEYKQEQEKAEQSLRNIQEKAALDRNQIKLNAQMIETEKKAALRRAIARQRAVFGASGVGSSGGSSQAVLLGLFDESDEEKQQRESLSALKTAAVDQNVAQEQRINTLQLTQLKERNRLNGVTSKFGVLSDLGLLD